MRVLLCCAVALMLVGCGSSSKNSAAPTGGATAPSGSTTTTAPGGTTSGDAGTSTTTGAPTTTAGSDSGANPQATGSFCADVRDGAVSTALGDAANPNPAANTLGALKKIDGEAPSAIKADADTLLRVLTQIESTAGDQAKQNALAADGVALQTAATKIGNYISAHCVG